MINSKDNIINAVNQIIDDLFIKDKYGKRIEVKSQKKYMVVRKS